MHENNYTVFTGNLILNIRSNMIMYENNFEIVLVLYPRELLYSKTESSLASIFKNEISVSQYG